MKLAGCTHRTQAGLTEEGRAILKGRIVASLTQVKIF